jgi:hypothetical protein
VPDDQFEFDAERHAELVTLVTVHLGQFVAVESELGRRLGRQFGPAIAIIVGEPGVVLAFAFAFGFGQPRSVIAFGWLRLFRQPGVVIAWWVPVRRVIRGRRLQLRWFRAAPTAAAARLAHASVVRRFAGQRTFIVRIIVRITGRRGIGRGHAWHPG